MPSYKLTYFNTSGRGEPIRILFSLADVPFEDVRVSVKDWMALKPSFDGSSDSPLVSAVADSLADQMSDFMSAIFPWHRVNVGIAPGDTAALYQSVFIPARDKHFALFEKYLSKSTTGWLASSSSLTHADLWIGCTVEMLLRLVPDRDSLLSSYPLLAAHNNKLLAVPKVVAHIANRPKDLWF